MKIRVTKEFANMLGVVSPLGGLAVGLAIIMPVAGVVYGLAVIGLAGALAKPDDEYVEIEIDSFKGLGNQTHLQILRDELRMLRTAATQGLPAENRLMWSTQAKVVEAAIRILEAS